MDSVGDNSEKNKGRGNRTKRKMKSVGVKEMNEGGIIIR
jgi:hypothetical protein